MTALALAGLSVRPYNALIREGYTTIEQVRAATDDDLLDIRNLGATALYEIRSLIGRSNPATEPDLATAQATALLRLTQDYLARVDRLRAARSIGEVHDSMTRWGYPPPGSAS